MSGNNAADNDDAYNDAATQMTGKEADDNDAAAYVNAATQMTDDEADGAAVKQTTGNNAGRNRLSPPTPAT